MNAWVGKRRATCWSRAAGAVRLTWSNLLRLGRGERKQNFVGHHFWARGSMVSTVGRDETVIREYIHNQEQEDKRPDQPKLWK
ncbi:MAG: transposase [Terracidiphilus sp.]